LPHLFPPSPSKNRRTGKKANCEKRWYYCTARRSLKCTLFKHNQRYDAIKRRSSSYVRITRCLSRYRIIYADAAMQNVYVCVCCVWYGAWGINSKEAHSSRMFDGWKNGKKMKFAWRRLVRPPSICLLAHNVRAASRWVFDLLFMHV
jgi:hypothetical protein